MRNRRPAALAAAAAVSALGLGAIPAAAATAGPHHQVKAKVSITGTASASRVIRGSVVVFTFKVSAQPASKDVHETDFYSTRGGSLVFTSCAYGNGIDFTGFADGTNCEDLPASTTYPITYLVGVRATGGAGSSVSAGIRVDPDGNQSMYKTATAMVYATP